MRVPARHPRALDPDPMCAGLVLRCPQCGSGMRALDCATCGFVITLDGGILHALAPTSLLHYARFMDEYERIRACEGRGSESAAFYLGLPYRDSSGRHRRQWRMRARSYDYLLRHLLGRLDRQRGGRVLDLGAGNGWMSYRLALAGYRPCAVDLLTNDRDGLGAAAHYRAALPHLFPRLQADLARLPFADGQFDAAVFNASFHYAEDAEACLREALRCVRPGGLVLISDTPWYSSTESGQRMVAERRTAAVQAYGTACDSLASLAFLTDERLHQVEDALSIRWSVHRPWYGAAWAMRPLVAALRGRREPSRFRLYAACKPA